MQVPLLGEAEDDNIEVYDPTTHVDRTYMPYDAIRDANYGSNMGRGNSAKGSNDFFCPHSWSVSRIRQKCAHAA